MSVSFGWNTTLNYWNNERTAPYHITGVTLVDGAYRYRLNERQGNGVTAGTYTDTMVLFGRKVGSSVEPSAVRIYYAKVGSRDYIPVRYRGAGYLYDKVSGRLFGNQGTGSFAIGEDKRTARDYIQNGLVAMWDGIENAGWGVHDGDATVWKDLVGGVDAAKNGSVSFGVDFVSLAGGYFLVQEFAKSTFSNDYTIEVCLSRNESVTNAGVYSTNDDGLRSWISTYNGYYNFSGYVRRANVSVTNLLDVSDLKTFSVKADGSTAYSFKNGEQISSASVSTSSYSGSTPLYLFRLDRYSNFKGRGHCVRIYNRALTPAEIAANYDIDKSRFGLVG